MTACVSEHCVSNTVLSVKKSVRPVEHKEIALAVDQTTAEKLLAEYAKKHYVAKARLIAEEMLDAGKRIADLIVGRSLEMMRSQW